MAILVHRYLLSCLLSFICVYFLFSVQQTINFSVDHFAPKAQLKEDNHSENECLCYSNETKMWHNFCYHPPYNHSIRGKRFSCRLISYLHRLNLLSLNSETFLSPEKSKNSNDWFPEPVFVTAASQTHLRGLLRLVYTIQKFHPGRKIVFYDLTLPGYDEDWVVDIKRLCNVVYRRFPFMNYPDHVEDLSRFRWKPLVIAHALLEFGSIWYMDSSVAFKNSNISHVHDLLRCRMSRKYNRPLKDALILKKVTSKINVTWIESGFHRDKWSEALLFCYKYAYLLHSFTGHGIFSATDKAVYQYFPTDIELLKSKSARMYEAGLAFIVRTKEVVEDILKWYVLCALEFDCMSPPDYFLPPVCSFKGDRFSQFADCHRFDQSIINLLLANANDFKSIFWSSGIVDFFEVKRKEGISMNSELLTYC